MSFALNLERSIITLCTRYGTRYGTRNELERSQWGNCLSRLREKMRRLPGDSSRSKRIDRCGDILFVITYKVFLKIIVWI